MTDDYFPDLLRERGVADAERVQAYWGVAEVHAKVTDPGQAARLVEFAHGKPAERERDEWFWRPYREADVSFPVTDAIPLHGVLADASVRLRIGRRLLMDAMLVRLAQLDGWAPATALLRPAADGCFTALAQAPALAPAGQARKVWGAAEQKKIDGLQPGTVETLGALAQALGDGADQALGLVRARVEMVADWASRTQERQSREQAIVEWLLAGTRADGVPWEKLPLDTVVVDAPSELARMLQGVAPQPHHERLLTLLLRAIRKDGQQVGSAGPMTAVDGQHAVPKALLPFTPILDAMSRGVVPEITAEERAIRLLWEGASLAAWPMT